LLLQEPLDKITASEEKEEYIIVAKFAGSAQIPVLKLITKILSL